MANLETPITTQEDLDAIISRRLKEEKERYERKYADYDELKTANELLNNLKAENEQLNKETAAAKKSLEESAEKYKGYDAKIAELEGKVHGYEIDSVKTKVALSSGLPYEMASRLRGETEEEIQKDADNLKGIMKPTPQPMAASEPMITEKSARNAALKSMLSQLGGNKE